MESNTDDYLYILYNQIVRKVPRAMDMITAFLAGRLRIESDSEGETGNDDENDTRKGAGHKLTYSSGQSSQDHFLKFFWEQCT